VGVEVQPESLRQKIFEEVACVGRRKLRQRKSERMSRRGREEYLAGASLNDVKRKARSLGVCFASEGRRQLQHSGICNS
jgi:hypothetical protein